MGTQDMENAKVVRDFLPQCFTSKCSSHIAQVAELENRGWENESREPESEQVEVQGDTPVGPEGTGLTSG